MKKNNILYIIIIISFTIILSCSSENINYKDDENSGEVSNIKVVNPCDSVGIIHNQGLIYIYNGLKVMKFEDDSILDSIYILYIQFIDEEDLSISSEEAYYLYIMGLQNVEIGQDTSICLLDSVIANSEFSSEQKEYLYRISNLEKEKLPLATLTDSVSIIISEAMSDLSESDQIVVLSTSSILIHSTEYWDQHYEDWEILLDELSGSKDTATVVMEDIIGGIFGFFMGNPVAGAIAHSAIEIFIEICSD